MKAITYKQYGGPEVLQVSDVATPTIQENQILVRTKAFALNPYDWHFMRGTPYFIRFKSGLFKPSVKVLGNDMAGVVEAVGSKVSKFKVGDRVVGSPFLQGFAELVAVDEEKSFHLPDSISFAEGASMVIAGGTAYASLVKYGNVKVGDEVLINGSTGGVGHYTIQIAKALGARVTAVCSTSKVEFAKSLGADEVIDYTKVHPAETGKHFDLVIENHGNLRMSDLKKLVNPTGTVVIVGFTRLGLMLSLMTRKKVNGVALKIITDDSAPFIPKVVELAAAGKIRTVIDQRYTPAQIAEAMEYLEEGHVPGKLVVEF